jgi:hypothetical protein
MVMYPDRDHKIAHLEQQLAQRRERAKAVLQWAVTTFGPVALNRDERAARFVEEALELGQAAGLDKTTILRLLDRVYDRPIGNVAKEIGQAGMTLECLAGSIGFSVDTEIDAEFHRVRSIPQEEWNQRHEAKVKLQIANLSEPKKPSLAEQLRPDPDTLNKPMTI